MIKAKREGTRVMTGTVRLSYAHIFEPHSVEGNEPKYSVSIIIPKSDNETVNMIREAIKEAKELGETKLGKKIPASLKIPLRDGDEEKPDEDAYKNSYFLNASSKLKPGIIDKYKNAITDPIEVYSGCYARLTLNFYAFNTSGNKGIAAGLGNIQKIDEGQPLGGMTRAEDDFDEIEDENDNFLE